MKPNPLLRFIPDRWIVGLATLGPLGTRTRAPGTFGSAAGILLTVVVFANLSFAAHLILASFLVLLAIPICAEAELRLRQRDPGKIILDEFVAVPLCFIGLFPVAAPAWPLFLAGFLLFRLFDIAKPLGIGRLQNLRGGLGVVMDDVGAALATAVILLVIHQFSGIF